MPPAPDRPTLTPTEIRALGHGARVLIQWCGGNGPWLYELRHESFDAEPPYTVMAWSIHENRPHGYPDQYHPVDPVLAWDHEETWGERMLDKVWLPDG